MICDFDMFKCLRVLSIFAFVIMNCFCKTQNLERQRVGLFVRNRCVAGNSVSYLTSRTNPKCSGDCTDTFVSSEMQKQEL